MKKCLPLLLCIMFVLSACGAKEPTSTDARSVGSMTIKGLYEFFDRDHAKADALLAGNGVNISGTVTKVSEWKYYEPRNEREEVMRYAVILSDDSDGKRESILCTFHVSQKETVELIAVGDKITIYGKIVMLPKAKYPCLDFCRIEHFNF